MKKCHFVFVILCIILSCEKKDDYSQLTYNQKANELIQQVLKNDSCNCLLEIPNESMIKTSIAENPRFNIKKELIKRLHLKNQNQLDSLENVSENFILDTVFLKQKNITVIKRDSISELIENRSRILLKKCPKGVIYFSKPILNERNKISIISHNQIFSCLGFPMNVYNYKNDKWVYEKI